MNDMIKYKGVRIEASPVLPKFPNMVTVTKTNKKFKTLLDKKYIDSDKAILAIDGIVANLMIEKGRIKTGKELMALGMGVNINF